MRYSEAYCRLPIAALHRAFDAGRGTIVWQDKSGVIIGSAQVVSRFDETMRVAFDVSASGAVEAHAGEVAITIIWQDAGMHRREPYAECPACRRPVKHLIDKAHAWKCRTCHGLVNRGSLIRHNARLTELVGRLEAEVGSGRPKGMHNATFDRKAARLADCKARLKGNSLRADSRYDHVVTHHVSGIVKKPTLNKSSINDDKTPIFGGKLIDLLNHHFVENASAQISAAGRNNIELDIQHVASRIEKATRIRAIILGEPEELVQRSRSSGLDKTVVEVPFLGDARLLYVKSAFGAPLPLCVGRINEAEKVIRFVFAGTVDDRPTLRVQIDAQLDILKEQVARQSAAIDKHHRSLASEAIRFLKTC